MAHYIIDDWGFSGTYYRCSECGCVFWDILERIDHEQCPNCGELIDEDASVYMVKGKVES